MHSQVIVNDGSSFDVKAVGSHVAVSGEVASLHVTEESC
jgi:hypothetical protein